MTFHIIEPHGVNTSCSRLEDIYESAPSGTYTFVNMPKNMTWTVQFPPVGSPTEYLSVDGVPATIWIIGTAVCVHLSDKYSHNINVEPVFPAELDVAERLVAQHLFRREDRLALAEHPMQRIARDPDRRQDAVFGVVCQRELQRPGA